MAKKSLKTDDALGRKYERNFLTSTVVRLDFAAPISLKTNLRSKIANAVRKAFPVYDERNEISMEATIGPHNQLRSNRVQGGSVWVFRSPHNEKSISIAETYCFVEYSKYESFQVLHSDFVTIVDIVCSVEKDLTFKRLGLRYIDTIDLKDEVDPIDWTGYLNPALIANMAVADEPKSMSRVFAVIEMKYSDMQVRFQYGMMNPDYPAAIKRKVFILDHDAFADADLLEKKDVSPRLEEMRRKLKMSFERAIDWKLREKMGVKK